MSDTSLSKSDRTTDLWVFNRVNWRLRRHRKNVSVVGKELRVPAVEVAGNHREEVDEVDEVAM